MGDPPAGAAAPGTLVLRLHVEPGEPPAGWIEVDGDDDERRFAGWVGLLSAIGAARERARQGP